MKLTTFILILSLMQVSASTLGQHVTLKENNISLEKVFREVLKQTGYDVLISTTKVKNSQKINVSFENAPLKQVMNEIVKGTGLTYTIVETTVVIKEKEQTFLDVIKVLLQEPIRIKGKITDSLGAPLEGATIFLLKKSKEGDLNTKGTAIILTKTGEFDIAAEEGDRIIVSFMGYASYSLTVKKEMPVQNIVLHKIAMELNEVMVQTGYQTLSKERATGSFGKPDMKVFAKRTGTMDIIGRLEGQVPGLQISVAGFNNDDVNVNGSGASTRKSLIRGTSSVRNPLPPLYVINGVIVNDFNSVNADDIEDITVLKDAAASAIWGARSANGVIVIKTKSGSKDGKISVNYSGFVNYSPKPDFSYSNMLNSKQYIQVAREIFDPVAYSWEAQERYVAPHDQILYDQYRHLISDAVAGRKLDSLSAIDNTGQIKSLYRPALNTNHTVSISGGSPVYSFYASLGYSGSQGNTSGARNDSYRISFNQNVSLGSRIRLSLNTSLNNQVSSSRNLIQPDKGYLPYQLFRDASGNPLKMNFMNGYVDSLTNDYQARSRINLDYIPLNETNLTRGNINNLNINVTANATIKIWKGLQFMGTYGYVKSPGRGTSYIDHQTIAQRRQAVSLTVAPTADDIPVYYYPQTGGAYSTTNTDQRNWTVRNQLAYEGSLRDNKDHFSIQAGQEIQQSERFNNRTTVLGYDEALGTYASPDYEKLRNGIFPTVPGFGYYSFNPYDVAWETTRFISYFALANYSFDDKYSLNASWRQDYSNQFASEISTQNKPIWSIGVRWQLNKEEFLKPVEWLNSLGIRATYGITGNSPYLGAASQYDILSPVNSSNNYDYNMIAGDAFTIGGVGNKTLAWENTNNINIGIDYSIFKGRISGGIDLYKRVTTDMLGSVRLNPLTGFTSLTGNIGKMVNKGIELSLHTENIRTKDFNWSTSFNIGYNNNKLVSYSTPSAAANTVGIRMAGIPVIGYSMNPLWAYRFAGLDNAGDPQIYLADGSITKKPNVAKIGDLKYMGTTRPVYNGGFGNNFTYKTISISANMIYSLGAVMRRDVNTFYSGQLSSDPSFNSGNISDYFLNRWKKPGDEAFTNIPGYTSNSVANNNRNVSYYTSGDINVVSASYVAIRDISLSYDLNSNLLRVLNIRSASVFVQATNFLVWAANDQGLNPELSAPSSGVSPIKHTYSLGINFSF